MINITLLLIKNGFGGYQDVMSMPFNLVRSYHTSLTKLLKDEKKNDIDIQLEIMKKFKCPLYSKK